MHSEVQEQHLAKILILKLERIMEKIPHERRVFKSVDDKSLPWDISQKSRENRIQEERV